MRPWSIIFMLCLKCFAWFAKRCRDWCLNKILYDDCLAWLGVYWTQILKVSAEELQKELSERTIPLVIDFYATWCGPCLLLAKELEKVSSQTIPSLRPVDSERFMRLKQICNGTIASNKPSQASAKGQVFARRQVVRLRSRTMSVFIRVTGNEKREYKNTKNENEKY